MWQWGIAEDEGMESVSCISSWKPGCWEIEHAPVHFLTRYGPDIPETSGQALGKSSTS